MACQATGTVNGFNKTTHTIKMRDRRTQVKHLTKLLPLLRSATRQTKRCFLCCIQKVSTMGFIGS